MSDKGTKHKGNGSSAGFFARICDPKSGTRLLTPVLAFYVLSFLVHLLLNMLVKMYPTVVIDEGLYTNIARSLAWKGELEFRAQPVNYPYLLYPYILVPVYWLQRALGGDVYRMIQVLGTLLITSSVFPVTLFAFDFTKSRRKAYTAALITALMPDMLMGAYSMTECLVWPLSLWMVFFAYRFFTGENLKYGMLTALFTGLLYAAKPGAIACGAAILAAGFLMDWKRGKKTALRSLLPLLLLLFMAAAVYLIFMVYFQNSDSPIGLYTKQTSKWQFQTIFVALEAFFLQSFLFVFACGGVCALLPPVFSGGFDERTRRFVFAVSAGILVTILGTAVFVVPFSWDDSLGNLPLHLRYCAMYIPVMMVMALGVTPDGKKTNKVFPAVLAAFSILSIFPGARSGFVDDATTEFDSMALSSFTTSLNHNGHLLGWVLTLITVAFTIYVLITYLNKGFTDELQNRCIGFFAVFILINAVSAHINTYISIDPTIASDAREINELVGDRECLGITQQAYKDYYSYWLDSRLNEPMQQVTVDQMFLQMKDTEGIYKPFVPVEQSPNVHNHETPVTDCFVLGKTIAEHMELAESVSVRETKSGHFSFLKIDPSERWVDTMMFGLSDNTLREDITGYVMVLNENRSLDGKLILRFRASGDGILDVGGARIPLTETERDYEITLPFDRFTELKAEGGSAEILSYSTAVR